MADGDDATPETRTEPIRTRLEKNTSSRATAGQSPNLTRLRSGTHLDDQSHYHHHHDHDSEDSDADTLADNEVEDQHVSQATLNHDVEAGPRLEKAKSSRSQRDPNLVAWNGKDDVENPKNWTMKRKWAATFIGVWS